MENSRGPSSIGSMVCKGKSSLLPPKIPHSGIPSSFSDYIPISAIGRSVPRKPVEGNLHQRTSSEFILIEEPPSWLNDLLDEPDMPVRRGHRRSSSDSLTYFDASTAENMKHVAQDATQSSIWGSEVFDVGGNTKYPLKNKNKPWDAAQSSVAPQLTSPRETAGIPNTEPLTVSQDVDTNRNAAVENHDHLEYGAQDSDASFQKSESSHVKPAILEPDTRRAKQQYAQRSRVRKLQYIAGLERNVQALHAEGSEVSAEIEFLNQQNLILSLENKALKQRLESLSQEHLIKCLEHDILEREAVRLRSLYQHLLLQQPAPSGHRRTRSRDLDQQLAKLSLKQKE